MGCTTSTRKRCRYCESHYSPVRRSYSIQTLDPQHQIRDSYRLLSLSSTSLNSFSFSTSSHFDPTINDSSRQPDKPLKDYFKSTQMKKRMAPMTPCMTPPGEPEVINAWEIMEGLEEWSPLIKDLTIQMNDKMNALSPRRIKDYILVVYITSLRGVRKTYEDCCNVMAILKGMGLKVDERDVSMHSGFKEELRELLGDGCLSRGLPLVFIGKKYIGGAEEIKRLHEEGLLEKMAEGCVKVQEGRANKGGCLGCGDVRFVPCERCNGSCKVFYEEDDLGGCDLVKSGEFGFYRCPYCNENGLVRCPICCF